MAAEDIEKKVRSMAKESPEKGQELQKFQEAQNQLVQVNAERQSNLQVARVEDQAMTAQNETLAQAAEMAAMGTGGVQQQVQSMNPQTQAVLGKYGLGQPKVQRSSSRSVQVTPQKITINNNTTNTTTNNVAVPAANVGGPVQGRTLAIKQNPDESQARFKTWIANAFAKQNQQAAVREKEYQRREWSLTRSTNKLMKHLSDMGKSVSSALNPQRMASSVGGQLKTMLFLFGTMFLAKNWKKVISIGASIERFLVGEVISRDESGNVTVRGEAGYKDWFRNFFAGKNGAGGWLVKAFGGKDGESIGQAFKNLFWNGESEKTGKDAGIFNILLKKIKDWFEEGVLAAKSLEIPKGLLSKEPLEALQSLIEYFSGVISALFTGGKSLRKSIESSIDKKGEEALRSKDIGGRYRVNNDKKYHEILKDYQLESLGITDEAIIASGVNRGDNAISADGKYSTHLMSNDLTKEGKLTGTVGSVIRQVNNIGILARDEDKMNLSGYTKGMRNLDEYMKEDSKKGEKATGLVLESTDSWRKLGVDPSLVTELRKSGHVKTKKFVNVVDKKTAEEMREELKHATSAEKEAAKEYANQYIKNKIGVRKSIWKIVGGIAGAAGGLLLAPATGGTSLFISAAALGSAGLGGAWLGSKLAGGAHDIIMDERLQSALKWAVTHDEIKEIRPYIIRTVPEDEVGDRPIVKGRIPMTKEVLDYEGWQKIKESQGMLTRDSSGKVTNERNYDLLNNEYWRENASHYYKNVAARQGIDLDDIPTETDIDDFNFEGDTELDEMRERHRKEQEEFEKNSRLSAAGEHWSGAVGSVKNYFSGKEKKYPPLASNQKEFVDKMRTVYKNVLEKKGIDTKYADVLTAQSALESSWGKSQSGKFNFSGIKADKDDIQKGLYTECRTTEYENGVKKEGVLAKFRDFNSLEDFAEYKVNFVNRDRYKAFDGDSINDYINRVVNGGYATAPDYGEILADVVRNIQSNYPDETVKNSNNSTESTQGETQYAENITQPEQPKNYVEQKSSEYTTGIDSYEWGGKSINPDVVGPFDFRFGGKGSVEAMLMAQNNSASVAPEKVTQTAASKSSSVSTTGGNVSSTVGRDMAKAKETNGTEEILNKMTTLNDNIKLLQQGQLAQIESTNNVASGLGNMTINVNQGEGNTKVAAPSWSPNPFNG